ncbi:threonine/serine exporter ThrE family protein [Nostocoides sp. F2B08]|uniref:threonine/serine ThrE exporter family protein n=1 Tax=Nostocoides sp. F2B08 TaxID=2653936 RepID=UPI00186AEFB3|nr:threonine/serine exporter family protein [Tetrasphaera sp. F2B08]
MRDPETGPETEPVGLQDVGDRPDPAADRGIYPVVEPTGPSEPADPAGGGGAEVRRDEGPVAAAADTAREQQREDGRSRLWHGDTPTQPMPIVDRLRHTPYRMSRSPKELTASESEVQAAGEAIDIALRLGELMLRCGAAASKVEASIVAVGAAAGLRRLDVDITLQSLLMQCVLSDGQTITRLRVVQGSRQDFARLDGIHRLVEEIVADGFDAPVVRDRLRRIQIHRRNYPDWMVLISTGVFAGAVTFMLGAGFVAVLITIGSAMVVHRSTRVLGNHGFPEFYQVAAGGFIATSLAWLAYVAGIRDWLPLSVADFAYMVAGGIVVLLPGRAMASAVEDVISGYQVTGAGRMLAVLLNTSGLIIGVAGSLSLTLAVANALESDFVSPEVLDLRTFGAPLSSAVIGAFVLGLFASVTVLSRRLLLVPIALLSAGAVLVYRTMSDVVGMGQSSSVGVGAVFVGVLGALIATRAGAPALTVIIPSSFGLLPGLTIFRGLYEMVVSSGPFAGTLSVQSGITTLLGAMATLLAIATGTTLGDIMMNPVGRRLSRARWDHRRRRQG